MYLLPGQIPLSVYTMLHAAGARRQNARTARSEARTERTDLAANSSFFEADANPGIFHQRRCSTADRSGLPDLSDF